MRMVPPAMRISRSVLCACLAAACTTWTRPTPPQTAADEVNGRRVVIVSLRDTTTYLVADAQIRNDSLIGVTDAGSFSRPLSAVSYVSVKQRSRSRTVIAIAAIGLAAAALLFVGLSSHHSQVIC